jgi:hypothetical protein
MLIPKNMLPPKTNPLDTSSGPQSAWASEWFRIHRVQSSGPLPTVFEQAFTVVLNTKDIHPNLHMSEHTWKEQETATIETAQAVQVQVQVKMQAIQTSNPSRGSLAPISEANTDVPALSFPPSALPIRSVTPASSPIAPTHKQASSISSEERQPKRKYFAMPEWNYITNRIARSLRRKEMANKAKEKKVLEEESSEGEAVVA